MILVTGASGTVLSEIAQSAEKHRAMYHSKVDAAKAPAGTETVIADVRLGRGAIVAVELDPTAGHEQQGLRPCVVVSVVPVTGGSGRRTPLSAPRAWAKRSR